MKLLVICGPTATGKTQLAVNLARKFNGEIISADSRQVYRRMDIATGKDLSVYGEAPVHMLDIIDPTQPYSVAQYTVEANKVVTDIIARGKFPILVGGTGLYIKAVIDGIQTSSTPSGKVCFAPLYTGEGCISYSMSPPPHAPNNAS